MAEEILETNEQTNEETDYVDIINDMRANTVPKNDYNRLKADNVRLMKALANGEHIDTPIEQPVDIDQLRKELYNQDNDFSNLEYAEKTLKLRKALMDRGEPDPFIPVGRQVNATTEDIAAATRVAEQFQNAIDFAGGDSEVFTNELTHYTQDVVLPKRRKN